MGKFTVIPESTFNDLIMDAGVLLKNFDPATAAAPSDSDIICATTGGIQVSCVPTYSDLGEDVDNCPNNTKELKHLDGWDCKLTTTCLGTSPELIKLALGAADIDGSDSTKVVPRASLSQSDFTNIWWVGDKANGGMVAVKMLNALSTGGFSLQTTKNAKGQVSIEITGHVSLSAQTVVPVEFYSASSTTGYTVTQRLTNCTSSYESPSVESGGDLTAVLTADANHSITNVVVLMGGADVTSSKYTSGTHTVAITGVSGDVEIIATANHT